jgi:hypothetical protein
MAEAEKNGERDNAEWSHRTEKRCDMGNNGEERAIDCQNCGQKIQTTEKIPRECE